MAQVAPVPKKGAGLTSPGLPAGVSRADFDEIANKSLMAIRNAAAR